MRSEPALAASGSDVRASMLWGLTVAGVLIAGIFLGSRGLKDFDPALVSYAGAAVFSAFGVGYRYSMWLRRPPTRLYWIRGWLVFLAPKQLPAHPASCCSRCLPSFASAWTAACWQQGS